MLYQRWHNTLCGIGTRSLTIRLCIFRRRRQRHISLHLQVCGAGGKAKIPGASALQSTAPAPRMNS
jgi:hypothetical protein